MVKPTLTCIWSLGVLIYVFALADTAFNSATCPRTHIKLHLYHVANPKLSWNHPIHSEQRPVGLVVTGSLIPTQ